MILTSLQYFVGKGTSIDVVLSSWKLTEISGFNFFRVPFQMERLVAPATGITGPFSSAYLANLTTVGITHGGTAKS
jgi:hypothetical protein